MIKSEDLYRVFVVDCGTTFIRFLCNPTAKNRRNSIDVFVDEITEIITSNAEVFFATESRAIYELVSRDLWSITCSREKKEKNTTTNSIIKVNRNIRL